MSEMHEEQRVDEEFSETDEFTQADGLSDAERPARRQLPWRSYLRCLFLFSILVAVGFTAWRPAMLRFSLMMSAVSPSRGDSLNWKAPVEPLPPPSPRKRLPSPDEWRLTANHGSIWQASRMGNDDAFSYQGGPLGAIAWSRLSANPWAWEDDAAFGKQRRPDAEFQPNQKPATSFRAESNAAWGTVPSPADTGSRPPSQSAQSTTPSRTVPELAPLPGVAERRQPRSLPEEDSSVADVFSALQIPSLSPRPTTARPTTTTNESPFATTVDPTASAAVNESTPFSSLSSPGQDTAVTAGLVSAPTGSLRPGGMASPTTSRETPSGTGAVDMVRTPVPAASGDWKNQEITAPIEGAYLTVYPKLKFIGLCVPGQDYVRKYNQVAIPMDLVEKKVSARDGRAPYGKYYIAQHERGESGAGRLVLSWPSPDDARRLGLDAETVQAVENAWQDKILPPQTTSAGGGVALEEAGPGQEWTAGGFALERPQMEELFLALPDGAWVFIQE